MVSRPFSPRINLEQSRKQAKDILEGFRAADPAVLEKVRWNHPRFRGMSDGAIRESPFRLADAQLVVARLHHFDSWPKLLRHIESLERREPAVIRYERAADAIVSGDARVLRDLLQKHPELVHQHSTRAHRSLLLHYVSANGVEDYRQLSPPNSVEVARLLLEQGAEVDATSEAYGGGSTTLGLVSSSQPPRRAGVQIPLIDLLLDRGASIEGVAPGKSPLGAALANGCPEAARALVDRGARVPDVVAAAGVGWLDLVKKLAERGEGRDLEEALVAAAGVPGATDVVEFLLDGGVDVAASTRWTALHHATGSGDLRTIDLLIRRGAPLETENMYGGTALGQAIWYAYNGDPASIREYAAVIEALVAAGARTDAYPRMGEHLAEIRRRARA